MKVMYSIEEGGENPLTDEEQKQIFAKNLNRYIALSQKMQKYERWLIISE